MTPELRSEKASASLWYERQLGEGEAECLDLTWHGEANPAPRAQCTARSVQLKRYQVELLVGRDVVFEWVGRASGESAAVVLAQSAHRIVWRSWLYTSGITETELPLSLRGAAARVTRAARSCSAAISPQLMREAKELAQTRSIDRIAEEQLAGFVQQLVWTDPLLRKKLRAGDGIWVDLEVSRDVFTRAIRVKHVIFSGRTHRTSPAFTQPTSAALLALATGVLGRDKTWMERPRLVAVVPSGSATLRAYARVQIPVDFEPLLRFLNDRGHVEVEKAVRHQATL